MTGSEYRALRKAIGSQTYVARLLGLDVGTISRRERSEYVTIEKCYALMHLAVVAERVGA